MSGFHFKHLWNYICVSDHVDEEEDDEHKAEDGCEDKEWIWFDQADVNLSLNVWSVIFVP